MALTEQPDQPADQPQIPSRRAADASPWNWLLAVPIVLPLLTVLYNRETPHFLGFPAFYWIQLFFVVLGVASTSLVYWMTKPKRED